jgi:hypothetical protein
MKTRNNIAVLGGLTLAAACQLGVTASAQLTHYVPFDENYAVGGDLGGSGGMDLGFGENVWFDGAPAGEGSFVVEGNLDANGVDTLGNHASTPGGFNLAFYTFNNNPLVGVPDRLLEGVHWLSFIAQTSTEADFGGLSLVKFFGPEILYIGKVGGNGGTEWGADPGGAQQAAGGDCNEPTFIVVKLTLGPGANDDLAEIYINPDPGATAPVTPDASVPFNEDPNDNRAIDEIRIGGQNGTFAVDEIRIGGTYADVAPGTPLAGGCNDADLAEPFDVLDLGDIGAFVSGFTGTDPIADLDNNGIYDLGDIGLFVTAFTGGCP